jgi:hypothetical protein
MGSSYVLDLAWDYAFPFRLLGRLTNEITNDHRAGLLTILLQNRQQSAITVTQFDRVRLRVGVGIVNSWSHESITSCMSFYHGPTMSHFPYPIYTKPLSKDRDWAGKKPAFLRFAPFQKIRCLAKGVYPLIRAKFCVHFTTCSRKIFANECGAESKVKCDDGSRAALVIADDGRAAMANTATIGDSGRRLRARPPAEGAPATSLKVARVQ